MVNTFWDNQGRFEEYLAAICSISDNSVDHCLPNKTTGLTADSGYIVLVVCCRLFFNSLVTKPSRIKCSITFDWCIVYWQVGSLGYLRSLSGGLGCVGSSSLGHWQWPIPLLSLC